MGTLLIPCVLACFGHACPGGRSQNGVCLGDGFKGIAQFGRVWAPSTLVALWWATAWPGLGPFDLGGTLVCPRRALLGPFFSTFGGTVVGNGLARRGPLRPWRHPVGPHFDPGGTLMGPRRPWRHLDGHLYGSPWALADLGCTLMAPCWAPLGTPGRPWYPQMHVRTHMHAIAISGQAAVLTGYGVTCILEHININIIS